MTHRKPIRRVAIIGAGIAGLSSAHALIATSLSSDVAPPSPLLQTTTPSTTKSNTTESVEMSISIFDARPGLDGNVGAGIQLNGALAVLGRIRPDLQRAIIDAGQPVELVRSRSKPWLLNNRPNDLMSTKTTTEKKIFESLLELPLREAVMKGSEEVRKSLLLDNNNELLWTSIMRGTLQETMFTNLPAYIQSSVAFKKELIRIEPNPSQVVEEGGGGAICIFSDGTRAGPFDLVIGTDGIKSAVKEYVNTGRITADSSRREGSSTGIYTGLRIRYAVQDGKSSTIIDDPPPRGVITQYFGDAAYCFCAQYGTGKNLSNARCAFLTYLDADYWGPFRRQRTSIASESTVDVKENSDWTQDNIQSAESTRALMLRQIEESGTPDVDLRQIIESADRFFELGVYAHNPFCKWSAEVPGSNGAWCVLAGDAAHALPPFLGQGGNQAIQDSYCLATLIHSYNQQQQVGTSSPTANKKITLPLESFLKKYENIRWPATFAIFWKSVFLGYLETGGFQGSFSKVRDVFFKCMGVLGVARLVLLSAAVPKV